ncbi:hypothetical protein O181_108022 [Austropuccinia psidii MF-1]|uniref:Uncharacterized protein n=1 Tax=Austropuccinia psidii MF-1 TaxID=1389203 RepID=A0A9Q3JV52_9BASI|nr:hypothetical protein [Austropuccinia psidii MF-1]
MQLTSDMAAVIFLHSLDNDNELSSLCQTLYDLKPFNLNTITDRIAVEHTRRQSEGATIHRGESRFNRRRLTSRQANVKQDKSRAHVKRKSSERRAHVTLWAYTKSCDIQ